MATASSSGVQSRLQNKLDVAREAWGLPYLVYLHLRPHRSEGLTVWAGERPVGGAESRETVSLEVSGSRAELQWGKGSVKTEDAETLLRDLERVRKSADLNWVVDYLHGTICQSLTAAHLHLELGLMDASGPCEEYEMSRKLLHESMISLREFIDDLSEEDS